MFLSTLSQEIRHEHDLPLDVFPGREELVSSEDGSVFELVSANAPHGFEKAGVGLGVHVVHAAGVQVGCEGLGIVQEGIVK